MEIGELLATKLKKYVCWEIILVEESRRFWEITTDGNNAPQLNLVCDEIPGLNYKDVGNLYGCRIGLNMV